MSGFSIAMQGAVNNTAILIDASLSAKIVTVELSAKIMTIELIGKI